MVHIHASVTTYRFLVHNGNVESLQSFDLPKSTLSKLEKSVHQKVVFCAPKSGVVRISNRENNFSSGTGRNILARGGACRESVTVSTRRTDELSKCIGWFSREVELEVKHRTSTSFVSKNRFCTKTILSQKRGKDGVGEVKDALM